VASGALVHQRPALFRGAIIIPIITFYMVVYIACSGGPTACPPLMDETQVATIEECIGMVATAVTRIKAIESDARTYRVGCSITVPKIKAS